MSPRAGCFSLCPDSPPPPVWESRGGQGSGVALPPLGWRAASWHCWLLERWPWAWMVGRKGEEEREFVRDLPSLSSTFPTPCDPGVVMSLVSHGFSTDHALGLFSPPQPSPSPRADGSLWSHPLSPPRLTALSEKPWRRSRAGPK